MEIRTKFNIIDSQGIMYTLRSGTTSTTVYDFEISLNKRY